ncbi:tartrate-resistant acid phosphatase type 5 [Marchantia polymorpha subsp. ruderalis]|uniref:acid phosphatase n=2 Tax=Marchantia polymorpha TaxID=3197 RepID=A0A176WDG5_MARPO|nr:hypothetical protein AXG93_150s1090 [Marchantia polymorpha subsp. ruderalis]PTQ38614.1 hypothetical protein MARPO_0050s0071 [Marchantia polymorpha]BBN05401.1 hypothetical protein Mp_3g12790 [Marchantia polymorpha subsp. ruderalis]|eukprot:PTQ38614.1 hypothetical protein MARPO_0050s0071 [Marchantia polymorpha]
METSERHRDAEIGLLTEEVKSHHHFPSATKTTWRKAALTLVFFCLILGIIFAFLHEDSISIDNGNLTFGDDQPLDALSVQRLPLNVLIVGDWGRKGLYNQSQVARQMSRVGKELQADFILSTGDNFYDSGLKSVNDKSFEESFTDVYHEKSLQKRWYAVLGNHDYRGNEEAQVDKSLNKRDPRWWCDYFYTIPYSVSPSSTVEFFMIDTNPFVEEYWTPDSEHYKWARPTPREEVMASTLENLSSALEKSPATWKIVVGHHTMYSYGPHRNTPEIIEKVLPILEANKVDLYINGHDHCLEHIKRIDSDVHFVTSGGGSKAWKNEFLPGVQQLPDVKLYYDGQGFISLSASPTSVIINFFDINGKILHNLGLSK